jgi:hypothetical protein
MEITGLGGSVLDGNQHPDGQISVGGNTDTAAESLRKANPQKFRTECKKFETQCNSTATRHGSWGS